MHAVKTRNINTLTEIVSYAFAYFIHSKGAVSDRMDTKKPFWRWRAWELPTSLGSRGDRAIPTCSVVKS